MKRNVNLMKIPLPIFNCTNQLCLRNNSINVPLRPLVDNEKGIKSLFDWTETYTCPSCKCIYFTCRLCSIGKRIPQIMIKRELCNHLIEIIKKRVHEP